MQLSIRLSIWVFALLLVCLGCNKGNADPRDDTSGIILNQAPMSSAYEQMTNCMSLAPVGRMKKAGVACVQGGVRAELLTPVAHRILLSMPQLTDVQIPLCYAIAATPREVGTEFRLLEREGSNTVVTVQLKGAQGQAVEIHWSALVLLTDRPGADRRGPVEPYLKASACVQSTDQQVRTLAERLWPADGKVEGYAAAIQDFIRHMKQESQPRSLDALSILESRANWICTANANLAAALLRAKGIACRSVAVVPTVGQRLEMHRIIEYFDAGHWGSFDPSSLQPDVPLKSWQNIIMARTTLADEELAMKPRMGSSVGCPYGQEFEMLDSGVSLLAENDFFWTQAKPLAEYEVSDRAIGQARKEWENFMRSGELSQGQLKAAGVTNAAGLLEAFETK